MSKKIKIIKIQKTTLMKKATLIITAILFYFTTSFSQENLPISKGFITIFTNQKIKFVNLRYIDDQVVFTNVETKSEFTYFIKSIKSIQDEGGNIIYTNKALINYDKTNETEIKKTKHIYPDTSYKNTVRAEIILVNKDTLYTNIKVSTNLFDSDLINELSLNKKISVVEKDTETIYQAQEIKQIVFTDFKGKERTFVLSGKQLIEKLFDGNIKWFRYYSSNSSGNVSSGDFMVNEGKETIGISYLFNTKKNLKKITIAKPELIPLIESLKINDSNILEILKKYDQK